MAAGQGAHAIGPRVRMTRYANQVIISAKIASQAPLGSVVRLGASIPAIAMAISKSVMSVSVMTAPRCHGRAATAGPR